MDAKKVRWWCCLKFSLDCLPIFSYCWKLGKKYSSLVSLKRSELVAIFIWIKWCFVFLPFWCARTSRQSHTSQRNFKIWEEKSVKCVSRKNLISHGFFEWSPLYHLSKHGEKQRQLTEISTTKQSPSKTNSTNQVLLPGFFAKITRKIGTLNVTSTVIP